MSFNKKIHELHSEHVRDIVCKALAITTAKHSEIVFEAGINYIKRYLSLNDLAIESAVSKSTKYWAWWRNQWYLNDKQFIHDASLYKQDLPFDGQYLTVALELYYDMHQCDRLVPNRDALNDIHAKLRELYHQEAMRIEMVIKSHKNKD